MKIAIPVSQGILCAHFGHCDIFAIIETDVDGQIISNIEVIPPPHEPGVLPEWLVSLGVNHVIAGGMGSRAQGLFADKGISLTLGAYPMEPGELVKAFISGNIATGENVCDH